MMQKRCETCRFADWEEVSTDLGSYWSICGCYADNVPDDDCGDTKDCPVWEKEEER